MVLYISAGCDSQIAAGYAAQFFIFVYNLSIITKRINRFFLRSLIGRIDAEHHADEDRKRHGDPEDAR